MPGLGRLKTARPYSRAYLQARTPMHHSGMILRHHGTISGGNLRTLRKKLARRAFPLLKNIFKQVAAETIPALSSLAGDKLSEKGWSTASELTQLAGSEAGKRIRSSNQNLGGVQQNVADFISQRGNEMLAKKFLGSGNRNLGAGNRNLGAGNRILGKKSFSSLEDGANFA